METHHASQVGTCPHCDTDIRTAHILIEYETSDGQAAVWAECPACQDVVDPRLTATIVGSLKQAIGRSNKAFYECRRCGKTVDQDTDYCPACGYSSIAQYDL